MRESSIRIALAKQHLATSSLSSWTYKDIQTSAVCTRARGANKRQWTPVVTSPNSTVSLVINKTPAIFNRRTVVSGKTTVSTAANASKSPQKSALSCTTALARAQEILLHEEIPSQTTSIETIMTSDEFVLVTHSNLPVANTDDEDDGEFVLLFS